VNDNILNTLSTGLVGFVYKKEADRLSRLARQKRDSQKTVQRYLQNEQAAKRKISKDSDFSLLWVVL